MSNCMSRIQKHYHLLSYSERLFADYAIKNQESIIFKPITEISQELGIAVSTIIGGCKKMGFKGFKEFKISVAAAPNNALHANWQTQMDDSPSSKIYEDVILSNAQVIRESLEYFDPTKFNLAVDLILQARSVFICGEGASSVLALEAYDFLARLGFHCHYTQEYQHRMFQANSSTPEDVALIVSQTGLSSKVLSVVECFRSHGCPTIGISNFGGTPFGREVDLLLAALPEPSSIHENNYSFRVPVMCIIEALYRAILNKGTDKIREAYNFSYELVKADAEGWGDAD